MRHLAFVLASSLFCNFQGVLAASMDSMTRRAVVVGATGATGRQVVAALLNRNWSVTAVSRSHFEYLGPSGAKDPASSRLSEILVQDFTSLTAESFAGHDALFNCLGTTRGQAGSAEAFVRVEVEFTELASAAAKAAGIKHVSVVSAQGANKDAWVPSTMIHPMLYMRTLGEKEEAVVAKKFASVSIFRPGMLDRLVGDRAAENWVTWLLPSLALRVDVLATAMVKDAEARLASLDMHGSEQCETSPAVANYYIGNGEITTLANRM